MSFFPASESTLSAQHLSDGLKEIYDLSANTTCRLLRTGMNHLYLIQDSKKNFVYRVYSYNWRSKIEIEEELRLLNLLHANKLPISYPIKTKEGVYIHEFEAIEGKRYGVLFSFLEGKKKPGFNADESYAVGKLMARIHRLTENFKLSRITYDATKLFETSLQRTKAFFTEPSAEVVFLEQCSSYLKGVYGKANKDALRYGALHLDIWFDNMHFSKDGKPSIFDFDFCGNGWLVHDIGYYLYQLFFTNPDKDLYKQKATAFLQGYESITPISIQEKELIPYCGTAVLLFYISVQCDTYDTWSNIFLNEEHLKRFTGAMKRWMEYQGLVI